METTSLVDILAEQPFFRGMERRHLELLADCASTVRFKAGEFLSRREEEASRFYLVRSGKVAVDIAQEDQDPLVIQTLDEGDMLGWSWLFPPYLWYFQARAVEPTEAVAFDGRCMRGKCEEDSSLGYALLKRFSAVIIERLQATRMQLLDVYGTGKKPG